jgi:predicted 2-oxoglutarate/Fe(II)-dependent dioxygenase YbiX
MLLKVLSGALSPDICKNLLNKANEHEWEEALIFDGEKYIIDHETRNCKRVMFIDEEICNIIMNIIKDTLKEDASINDLVGINPMLRFMKYNKGNYFRPHFDIQYVDSCGNISLITIQIYLNDDFTGGETEFFDENGEIIYKHVPKLGDIILFDQQIEHQGNEVTSGEKYSMRTDIMYKNPYA